MWVLRASGLSGQPDGKTFRLSDGTTKTIGRATRADFIVDAPLVSRVHCRSRPINQVNCSLKISTARMART